MNRGVAAFILKVRVAGKVAKFDFASEDELFAKLEDEIEAQVADTVGLDGIDSALRNFEAVEIVHSRIELVIADGRFRKRRGGVDVRRNGEYEAWLGRTSKQLIEPRPGESVADALRREIDSGAS